MSLRMRQITRGLNTVIERALKSGFVPRFETITYRLSQYFGGRTLGVPGMRLRLWKKHGTSSSADYNATMNEIRQDLEDLYAEGHEVSRRLLTDFHYYDVEREKLRHRIEKLAMDIDKLLLMARSPTGYFDYFADGFTDLSMVDTASTDAYVDTRMGEVRLAESQQVERVNLEEAEIVLDLPSGAIEMAPASQMVDESANTAWLVKVPWSGEELRATVTINLPEPRTVNTLVVRQHSPKSTHISCEVFSGSWQTIGEEREVFFEEAFACDNVTATALRLHMRKREPDDTTGGAWCYFGIRDLALARVSYASSGCIVSRPYELEGATIAQVSLEAVRDVPSRTRIDFYVSFPREDADPYWTPISCIDDPNPEHPKVLNLQNAGYVYATLAPGSEGYATHYSTVNGIDFYRVATLPAAPRPGSVTLHPGPGQIERTCFADPQVYGIEGDAHIPLPQDFLCEIEKSVAVLDMPADLRLLPLAGGLPAESQGGFYKFKLYVQSDGYANVTNSVSAAFSNVSVYLNGKHVVGALRFVPGMNTLEVLAYKHANSSPSIDLGQALASFLGTCRVFAYRDPLSCLDKDAFFYEVSPYDRSFFTCVGSDIILNHDPSPVRFAISYQLPLPAPNKIAFMARLSRDEASQSRTPRLKMYRLRVSTIPGGPVDEYGGE